MTRNINYFEAETPELDAFLAEYDALCKKHGMQFATGEYGYDGGSYVTVETYNGCALYLNLNDADSSLPFMARAAAEKQAKYEADRAAEVEKLARIKADAPADPIVALEGLLRHMPTGHWSDGLFAAKAAAEKVLANAKR